jgi:putative flippase GtrA
VIVSASLVMLQVLYLKYFVWHDALSSTSGIILGFVAAYVVNRIQRRREDQREMRLDV